MVMRIRQSIHCANPKDDVRKLGPSAPPHGANTHLHRVCLAGARLAISKDADIEAINAGGDEGLHLLEHLGGHAAGPKGFQCCWHVGPHSPNFSHLPAKASTNENQTMVEDLTTITSTGFGANPGLFILREDLSKPRQRTACAEHMLWLGPA